MRDDLQFRREFVANRQPKRPFGLEHPCDFANPVLRPIKILIGLFFVMIHVIIVADVERWIGENEVDRGVLELREKIEAIALVELVEGKAGVQGHSRGSSLRSSKSWVWFDHISDFVTEAARRFGAVSR